MIPADNTPADSLLLGFTTVETREQAETLASESVARKLAACVQVDGPIQSFYTWQGKPEQAEEFRLLFKFPAARRKAISAWLAASHPYETPEWIVIESLETAEKYLQWAREITS